MSIYCPKRLREYLATQPRNGRHIMAKDSSLTDRQVIFTSSRGMRPQ
jgi:hypothetical protein